MRHRQCQMHGIRRDVRWNDLAVKKPRDQRTYFNRDAKSGQSFQNSQPFGGKIGIATGGFFQHGFGYEQVVFLTVIFPPSLRGFLIRRQPQLLAWPRHEVAWNRCFDVEPRFHSRMLGLERKRSTAARILSSDVFCSEFRL